MYVGRGLLFAGQDEGAGSGAGEVDQFLPLARRARHSDHSGTELEQRAEGTKFGSCSQHDEDLVLELLANIGCENV